MALINCMVVNKKELQEVSLELHCFIDNMKGLMEFKVGVDILNQGTIQMIYRSILPIFPNFLIVISITL